MLEVKGRVGPAGRGWDGHRITQAAKMTGRRFKCLKSKVESGRFGGGRDRRWIIQAVEKRRPGWRRDQLRTVTTEDFEQAKSQLQTVTTEDFEQAKSSQSV